MADLDLESCRQRRSRLCAYMTQKQIELCILTRIEHVQWLTGARFAWFFAPAVAVMQNGYTLLVGPEGRMPDHLSADEVRTYEARWHSTMRNDQHAASTAVLAEGLGSAPCQARRMGVEFSCFPTHWPLRDSTHLVDIEPEMYRLRRRKDPDELALLRRAITATERMYERARDMIAPGVNELDVFNALQAVAVRELGEPLTGTGNDYQCGQRGGPPRDRLIEAGELYILDLGPAYRGYFADNARTIAVTRPSNPQLEAHQAVAESFSLIDTMVRPGVLARDVFQAVQRHLDEASVGVFNHHLGHGIGLFPHEAPHLNPHWNDAFEIGDVFTAEPGLYAPELRAGLRLENDYLVTADGVELLTPFPLELTVE